MKKIGFILSSLFITLFFFAANAQIIKGTGKLGTDNRELSGFTEIIVQGSFNLVLTQGDKEGIRIQSDENVLELFQTRIDNKILYITMVADVKKLAESNVYVSVKELTSITLLNEIVLKSEGVIHFDELKIFCSGMSNINMEIFASSLNLHLTDGSYAYLKGYAEKFTAEIHDETELNGFDMQTDYCNILSTGLTEVRIDCQKDLKLKVTGGSNLYYTGEPVISQRVFSSTGFVVKRQKPN